MAAWKAGDPLSRPRQETCRALVIGSGRLADPGGLGGGVPVLQPGGAGAADRGPGYSPRQSGRQAARRARAARGGADSDRRGGDRVLGRGWGVAGQFGTVPERDALLPGAGCGQVSLLHGGDGQRERCHPRLPGRGRRRTVVHGDQGRSPIAHSGDRHQFGRHAAGRALRPVARGRTVAAGQGPGGGVRAVPEAAEDAADQGDTRYRAGWRSKRDLGRSACASGSNEENVLACRRRRVADR